MCFLLLAALLFFVGCGDDEPEPEGPTCVADTGCGCVLSSDCPLPQVCRGGRCLDPCEDDVDCPLSGICTDDGEGGRVCVSSDGCVIDAECPSMNVCYFGACVPECVADRDCPSDSACIESRCVRRE